MAAFSPAYSYKQQYLCSTLRGGYRVALVYQSATLPRGGGLYDRIVGTLGIGHHRRLRTRVKISYRSAHPRRGKSADRSREQPGADRSQKSGVNGRPIPYRAPSGRGSVVETRRRRSRLRADSGAEGQGMPGENRRHRSWSAYCGPAMGGGP